MSATERMLIHIGYHKTGSTWLQRVLFPDESTGFAVAVKRSELNQEIVLPKELHFDAGRVHSLFDPLLDECARAGRIPVLSNERFSGNPHSGGWDSRILAERLHALFPRARILSVIREQKSAIRSMYLQYVREGGTKSLTRYLSPPEEGRLRLPLFDFDFYAYDRLIALYRDLFGSDGVLVLPYEALRADPQAFADRICDFAAARRPERLRNQPANVALSSVSAAVKRPLNRLFVRDSLNPSAPFAFERSNRALRALFEGIDRRLPAWFRRSFDERAQRRIESLVGDRYRESNRRTAELIGEDLARWGYPT